MGTPLPPAKTQVSDTQPFKRRNVARGSAEQPLRAPFQSHYPTALFFVRRSGSICRGPPAKTFKKSEPSVAKHAFYAIRCNIPHLAMGRMSRGNALEADCATLASEATSVSSFQAESIIKPLFFKTVSTTIKSLSCSRASFFAFPKSKNAQDATPRINVGRPKSG